MIKAMLELPEQHAAALTFLLKEIPPAKYPWALTGSAALRLQGLDLSVNDLDLRTDAGTVFLLEKKPSPFMKSPVYLWESEHTLSYHGQAEIQGLQSLEHEALAYEKMGRMQKAELIRSALRKET